MNNLVSNDFDLEATLLETVAFPCLYVEILSELCTALKMN